MKNLNHDLIRHISMFCPMGMNSVSRHFETAQIACVLDLLKKLERENLVYFPYLEGLSIYPIMKYENGPEFINLIHRKVISYLTDFQLFNKDKPFSKDPMHHLMARPDLNEILEPYEKLKDDSLLKLAEVLRRDPNNFQIPIGSAVEVRAWFQEGKNQLRMSLITELTLFKMELIHLPDELQFFTGVQRLDLTGNKLKSLPSWIGQLTALTGLNLNRNQLENLPDSIANLTALKELPLMSNQLKSLPDSIVKLKSLFHLDLNFNQLESLPDSIGKLTALQQLFLCDNQLESLPDSIGNLKALQGLRLDGNPLKTLPPSIYELENFEKFGIDSLEEGAGGGGSKED